MKKLLLLLLFSLMFIPSFVWADAQIMAKEGFALMYTEILEPTADAANQSFSPNVENSYLYQVEIVTSADDAVTFTVNSGLYISSAPGTALFTVTTTGATSGEISGPTQYWLIPKPDSDNVIELPTWTLSGLGSGTIKISTTWIKK